MMGGLIWMNFRNLSTYNPQKKESIQKNKNRIIKGQVRNHKLHALRKKPKVKVIKKIQNNYRNLASSTPL